MTLVWYPTFGAARNVFLYFLTLTEMILNTSQLQVRSLNVISYKTIKVFSVLQFAEKLDAKNAVDRKKKTSMILTAHENLDVAQFFADKSGRIQTYQYVTNT